MLSLRRRAAAFDYRDIGMRALLRALRHAAQRYAHDAKIKTCC